jgi:hypothetical protein
MKKLKSLQADKARRTLGYFLGQFRHVHKPVTLREKLPQLIVEGDIDERPQTRPDI